jgi:S-adenosylmethionine decarboxylase
MGPIRLLGPITTLDLKLPTVLAFFDVDFEAYCKMGIFILSSTASEDLFCVAPRARPQFSSGFIVFILVEKRSLIVVGTEWMIDAAGCPAEALRDLKILRAVFQRVIAELNLQLIGEPAWQKFPPPGGVTGMALLTESHLTCHTYPEFGVATFNLYCCRARPAWPWQDRLSELLGADEVQVRVLQRQAFSSSDSSLEFPPYARVGRNT